MMGGRHTEPEHFEALEVGDEVIGDGNVRGTIIRTKDHYYLSGHSKPVREYVVKSETGERLMYAGEHNLQLVKKGLRDTAPPRPDLLEQLDEDLKRRPLAGLCA
jgi:hypothetical protein